MTYLADKNQVKSRLDFRQVNPTKISIPKGVEPNPEEVEKHVAALKKRGVIPDIIVTSSNELIDGINQLEAAKIANQEVILARVQPSKGINSNSNFIEIEISRLTPHPLQKEIYGEEDIRSSKVFQAIRESGDIEPITVIRDPDTPGKFRVIKGHTRTRSAEELGHTHIWAHITEYASELEEQEAFLSSNTVREESNEQKAKRAMHLWRIAQEKNKKVYGDKKGVITRDEVGQKLGWSGVTTEHAIKVVQQLETLPSVKRGQVQEAFKKSVDAAYKLVKPPSVQPQKQTAWNPRIGEKVEVTRGEFTGRRGEIRGTSGSYCMVWLEGDAESERHNLTVYELTQYSLKNLSTNTEISSVATENKLAAASLGLRDKQQVFPDKTRNEGFNPADSQPLPASYTGITTPHELALAISSFSASQLSAAIRMAIPNLDQDQINAIDNALTSRWTIKRGVA